MISTIRNPEAWRDLHNAPLCHHRSISNFGDFIPLRTNGVTTLVRRLHDGVECTVFEVNIRYPETVRVTRTPRRATRRAQELRESEIVDLLD